MEIIIVLLMWGISIPICIKSAEKIKSNKIIAGLAGFVAPIFAAIGYAYVASNHKKDWRKWIIRQ